MRRRSIWTSHERLLQLQGRDCRPRHHLCAPHVGVTLRRVPRAATARPHSPKTPPAGPRRRVRDNQTTSAPGSPAPLSQNCVGWPRGPPPLTRMPGDRPPYAQFVSAGQSDACPILPESPTRASAASCMTNLDPLEARAFGPLVHAHGSSHSARRARRPSWPHGTENVQGPSDKSCSISYPPF